MKNGRRHIRSKVIDATLRLVDKFSKPLEQAAEKTKHETTLMRRNARQIQNVGKSITSMGNTLTKLTVPITGILTASGKMTDEFQKNVGQINTLLDDKSHLQSYKDAVIKTSNDTGLSLDTVTKGMYQAVSSIGDGGKETQKIFNVMAKAAKGGGSEVSESVSLISAAMKGYGSVSESTAQKISDMAFQTQKLGVTTYKELAASMQPLFPLGKSLNVSYDELFGSMATLTGVTGNTAEVTTQLKGVFTGLLKPTESMQKVMKKYGYENGQAMIKAEGMSGVLSILQKETGGQSDKMAKLFSNSRALTAVLALTGAQYDTFNEKTEKMGEASGSTNQALKDMQTPMSKIRKTINIVKNSMTVFGEQVLTVVVPSITKLGDGVKKITERFQKLTPEQQQMVVKMMLVAATMGPVLVVFGKTVTMIGVFKTKWLNLLVSIRKFESVKAMLLSPAGKIVLVFAAIAAAVVIVYKNWDKITAAAKKFKTMVVKAMNDAGLDTEKYGKIVKQIAKSAVNAFTTIGSYAKKLIKWLQPIAEFIGGVFSSLISAGIRLIVGYFSGWLKSTIDIVNGVKTTLSGVIDFFLGVFTGNWRKVWEGVKKIFSGVFQSLSGIAKRPLNAVIGMVNTVISGLNKIQIPSWVPGVGGKGINISKIPMLAKGTNNWPGGIAQVNEKGGEIIDLPRGTRVYPHDDSVRMAKKDGNKTITVAKIADTIVVREESDIDKIVKKLVEELEKIPV